MIKETLSVSQVNQYIKSILDSDLFLSNISISGEISNLKFYDKNGQIFFTLKDDFSQISCVMFFNALQRIKFAPQNGQKIIIKGRINCYEKRGTYNIQVFFMETLGVGQLALAFETLKNKLFQEGLFDEAHKKAMPTYPEKILVIAASQGAAFKDILTVAKRRCPFLEVKLIPALVQGALATKSIIKAIKEANKDKTAEILIIARGGGSTEDLSAFNDEALARAIFKSRLPTVSAIGHEIDYTIADFVADLRAPTPSVAAELVVTNITEELNIIQKNLENSFKAKISEYKFKIKHFTEKLKLLDPKNILARGFSITKHKGKILKDKKLVKKDDLIITRIFNGEIKSKAE